MSFDTLADVKISEVSERSEEIECESSLSETNTKKKTSKSATVSVNLSEEEKSAEMDPMIT